jgi:hypothetical protein
LNSWRCGVLCATRAERTFQDAKSEAGWDELVALLYRAWIHHTALDALALWFVAHTTWQNSVTYNEIIRLSGILDEAQTTIPPYERPKIAKSWYQILGIREGAPKLPGRALAIKDCSKKSITERP